MDLPKINAEALIAAYGDGAYEQARTRARDQRRGEVIDGNRPEGHWDRVRREIARRTGGNAESTRRRVISIREFGYCVLAPDGTRSYGPIHVRRSPSVSSNYWEPFPADVFVTGLPKVSISLQAGPTAMS